jgi:hypothetical protein
MNAKMRPLEVFVTMHPLFVSSIVFANSVNQVDNSYNILYMNNIVAKYCSTWCIDAFWCIGDSWCIYLINQQTMMLGY